MITVSSPRYGKFLLFSLLIVIGTGISFSQAAKVTIDQDPRIPQLLALKKSLEKDNKLADKFTIQLYYGELKEANSTLRKYRNFYSSWPASIEYETPNYKVWVGNFGSRLEADRALIEVQRNFPSAFILKPNKRD